jgi:hypothetical protein
MSKKTLLYIGAILGIFVAALAAFFVVKNGSVNRESAAKTENTDLSRFPLEYKSEALGFSFRYPEGLKITEFADEKGDVVLAEAEAGNEFQIFITPFDEQGPLTPERIKQDVPTAVVKNVLLSTIDKVPAIVFESEEPGFGATFEVWFVWPESPQPHGNYLFQITSRAEFAEELSEILQTWKFIETN